jgi:hypothetical protein
MSLLRSIADLIETIQTEGVYRGKAARVYTILGRRAGFTSTSVMNDVKEFDNAVAEIPILTGAEALEIISDSASDTAAGTGARTVTVTYINGSNALVESGAITLNGVAAVAAGFTALEILWMETATAGSGGVAAGNVRLRTVAGPVELEQITAGGNKSRSARFRVPTAHTAYLVDWEASAISSRQDMRLRAQVNTIDRSLSTVYKFQDTHYLPEDQTAVIPLSFLKIPALATVKVSTISNGTPSSNRADCSFDICVIAN